MVALFFVLQKLFLLHGPLVFANNLKISSFIGLIMMVASSWTSGFCLQSSNQINSPRAETKKRDDSFWGLQIYGTIIHHSRIGSHPPMFPKKRAQMYESYNVLRWFMWAFFPTHLAPSVVEAIERLKWYSHIDGSINSAQSTSPNGWISWNKGFRKYKVTVGESVIPIQHQSLDWV